MRAEPVANALGPVGFLAATWTGLFLGEPGEPLFFRALAVGAGMWAAGWCAGRAGRLVLRDAVERIRATEEEAKKQAASAAAGPLPAGPQAGVPSPPAGAASRG